MNDIDDRHYEDVLGMSAQQQYWYFLTEVSVNAELWLLEQPDGDTLAAAVDSRREGHALFPLWPHRRFAQACATGLWEGCVPLRVDAWAVLGLLDEVEAKGDRVALLWMAEGKHVPVDPGVLRDDLRGRLEQEMDDEDDDEDDGEDGDGDGVDTWTRQEERLRALALQGDRAAAAELSRMRAEIGDHLGAEHWQRVADLDG